MKAQELRKGNWVTIKNEMWDDYANVPMRVTKIDSDTDDMFPDSTESVGLSLVGKMEYFAQFDEFIAPIPLTEDWKTKLGIKIEYYYSEDGLEMMIIKSAYHHVVCSKTNVDFVHTIQNLYSALTGEELTIID